MRVSHAECVRVGSSANMALAYTVQEGSHAAALLQLRAYKPITDTGVSTIKPKSDIS